MGNYCSGCCPSPPPVPNSQPPRTQFPPPQAHFPVESPPETQSPIPQLPSQPQVEVVQFPAESPPKTQSPIPQLPSQSQLEVVDLKQLYANIKDSTELDLLIRHVKHLLSVIEKARSPQDVKKYSSIGFVQGMIERAAKFLEAISTQGEALKSDKSALNLTSGMQTVISTALEGVGELHWMAVGFSAIAYVMDSIQQVTSNFKQCVRLLRKLVDLGERLPVLPQRMAPHEAEHLNEAVHAIVEGVISCCCCMSQRKIFKYLFASADEANLQDIGTVIDELHRSLILMVAMDIQGKIPRRYYPSEPQAPFGAVGIDDKVAEIIRLLDMHSKGRSQAVILYGFGGAGKTTLGDCVVSKLKRDLDLRGIKYSRIQLGVKQLNEVQQDLYVGLTKEEVRFNNFKDGQEKLKEVLEKETAFIFIDNALTKDQINDLLPSQLCLPPGSRLLLTSRNVNVTEELRCRNIVCHEYRVDGLPDEAAKKYFRQIVIRSEEIALALDEGRISLHKMDAVAEKCRGVPLLLKVYAQYLERHGSDSRVYDEILDRLQQGEFSFTDAHLGKRLLYVYDQMDEEHQQAFVDICTYFRGWEEEDVSYIVSRTVLKALIDGALVKLDVSNKVTVHDVLKAMGIKEGKKTRIQKVGDLKKSQEMKGIWLCNSELLFTLESEILFRMKDCLRVIALGRKIRLTSECDLPFSKLRFLQIEDLHGLPIFCSELLGDLRFLRIKTREYPESLSSSKLSQRIWMNLKSLGHLQKFAFECLEMTMFPNDCQFPASLIELDFSNCDDLQELPEELCSLTKLSKLKLDGCNSLKSLPEEFYNLSKLTYLSMEDCFDLQTLPANFGQLSSLGRLNLSGSSHLETLGADFGGLSSLESLNISDLNNLVGLPESFGDLRKLRNLTIKRCRSLRSLPERFGDLGILQCLDLSRCGGLACLPNRFGDLGTLRSLYLSFCGGLTYLPDTFGDLGTLQSLDLSGCGGLTCLPDRLGDLGTLQSLNLSGCGGLTCLPDRFGDLGTLQSLDLSGCGGLKCLPNRLGDLGTLQSLNLSGCGGLTCLPDRLGDLGNLQSLDLSFCRGLTCLPDTFGDLGNLQSLHLSGCGGLTRLPVGFGDLGTLQSLDLRGCGGLTCLPDTFGDLGTLQSLDLSFCGGLTCLPDTFGYLGSLQSLNLRCCGGLTCLPGTFADLGSLQSLDLSGCRGLTCLPDRFGDLSTLQSLDLSFCRGLTCLPDRFGQLFTLQSLDLRYCVRLTCLPDEFGDLGTLQSLDLSVCRGLTCLPDRFGQLRNLQSLDLGHCKGLANLPGGLGQLSNLQSLTLAHCSKLTSLPDELSHLSRLQYVFRVDYSYRRDLSAHQFTRPRHE